MNGTSPHERILFGLKVRQCRTGLGLSFGELSEMSGLSVSYLNEIEKGKKYPKPQKLKALAKALKIPAKELVTQELEGNLAPVGELLRSNFLQELPMEFFGIEPSKVVELIAMAPKQVGAFISTLVDLARNYSLREENFYFGALRSYLEMHHNYFEEIEDSVDRFRREFGALPSNTPDLADFLGTLLRDQFGYRIVDDGLSAYPELQELRAVYLPETRRLLLNGGLSAVQRAFQFGKELGFQYMGLVQRAHTSSLLKVLSFDEVLNHFKASYFSAALLIDRHSFARDLQVFLDQDLWREEIIRSWLDKYPASPEMIVQRMSNLLTEHFGIRKFFVWRFVRSGKGVFRLDKELNLVKEHLPSRNTSLEHFCGRWPSVTLLQSVNGEQRTLVLAQRAVVHDTGDTYLCLTLARPAAPAADQTVSITLGLLIDETLEKKVGFLRDPAISERVVNQTCERCTIVDCKERMAEPSISISKEKSKRINEVLGRLEGGDMG